MSGTVKVSPNSARRLFVRLGLVLVYAGLIAFVFVHGKGHTLILDNKDAEDGTVKAIESLSISVDGQDAIDLQAGDRDVAKIQGQSHRVQVTVKDSQMVEHRISVPLKEDTLLLSIPKLMAGAQPAVIKFVPKDIAPAADEQTGNSNAYTAPEAGAAPDMGSGAPAAAPAAPGAAPATPAP